MACQGEALLVFTRNAALLASVLPPEAVKKLILPLLVRAADQGAQRPNCSGCLNTSGGSLARACSHPSFFGPSADELPCSCSL